MSRPFKQPYRCHQLQELARQLHYAPPGRKAEQVRRIEQLHDEIEPDATYPVAYLAYRITRYRLERDDDLLLVGQAVRSDLRMMIDELSRSARLPGDSETRTLDEWAGELNVSRKTLERWRKAGLRWRWFVPKPGAAPQVGLTRSAVERFRKANEQRVTKASGFAQLDEAQRRALIDRAKEMIQRQPDLSLHQAAVRLSRHSGRSVEAMRQLLGKHEDELFPRRRDALTGRQKRIIARAARRGAPMSRIAERFGRSRSTIHRVVRSQRAAAAKQRELRYVKLRTFERDDADEVLLGQPLPDEPDGPPAAVDVADLPAVLHPLYRRRTFTGKTAHAMLIRLNYLKFCADRLRAELHPYQPRAAELDRFDELLSRADALRHRLIAAHLPTVLSVAKRHLLDRPHTTARLVELLKIGHAVLFEAIDSHDPSRPQGFDAYLRNRLLHRLVSEPETDAARAHRRLDDGAALRELVNHARRHGVQLNAEGAETQRRGEES